jgi:uncharacterized lipoprotein YajG
MSHRLVLACSTFLLAACAVPFTTSNDERKAACDRIAAQAIQTSSLQNAKDLAAQAAECYAKAQQ